MHPLAESDPKRGQAMRSVKPDGERRWSASAAGTFTNMSITKQSKPRQTRTTGSAASHRTEGKRRNDRHNYFYDVLYGNEGNAHWERKIKVK